LDRLNVNTKQADRWQTGRALAERNAIINQFNGMLRAICSERRNKSGISCQPVLYYAFPKSRHLPGHQQGEPTVYEAPAIIGTCINCIAPGSLSATLALILIGAGVALTAERRKLIRGRR
jgi:hypothetical protein